MTVDRLGSLYVVGPMHGQKSDKTFSSPPRSLLEQTKTGNHAGVHVRVICNPPT